MNIEQRIKEIEWRLSQYALSPSFWIDGNQYYDGDLVLVNDKVYICLMQNSDYPPDSNDWVEKDCYEAIFLRESCYLKESYKVIKDLQSEVERYKSLWETNAAESEEVIAELKEVVEDKKRLTREIDIALNEKNAAKQASLCDILGQVRNINRDEWQPIETAPKYNDEDEAPEKPILLLTQKGQVLEGYWSPNGKEWVAIFYYDKGDRFDRCECCFMGFEPTHWKPLPKTPEQNH